MNTHILHFTLGPVQGFVAEARRTRDLWAGSFLLSWLSAHAMLAVEQAGAEVVFPEVRNDPLMLALRSGGKDGGNPYIGSVPNRFKAKVPADFDVTRCANLVTAKWRELAEAVWQEFVKGKAPLGRDTEKIWDRQIAGFWDMAWVIGEDPGDRTDGAWLDQRKNWRSHVPTTEGGDHCQLMGFYQELSGYVRSRNKGERDGQDAFWKAMQEQKSVGKLNLRDRERLSAIALIKRLFVCLPELKDVIGWVPGGDVRVVKNWPSVSYIAAAPWLDAAWKLDASACETYRDATKTVALGAVYGETDTRLLGTDPPYSNELFFKLDGHFFHADAIRAMELDEFRGSREKGKEKERRDSRDRAVAALGDLCEILKKARKSKTTVPEPDDGKSVRKPPFHASEFYAVLLCDGDSIGKNLRDEDGEKDAKAGLATFTHNVPPTISTHMGVTIYAGGDDVLALLPLDTAIEAARAIRTAYGYAFKQAVVPAKWTLSAAIVFAQYHIPLRAVLAEARHQLDAVAKEQNGRDSLAISVLKPGGRAFAWVSAWQGPDPAGNFEPPHILDHLARDLQQNREFTTGFFYNVRERYEPLFDVKDGVIADYLVAHRMEKFLEAEYRTSGGGGDSETRVKELMRVALPFKRQDGVTIRSGQFSFDAGQLIRFLAQEGRWFMTP